jgi:ABC-type sugar transport system substrate-binding protein
MKRQQAAALAAAVVVAFGIASCGSDSDDGEDSAASGSANSSAETSLEGKTVGQVLFGVDAYQENHAKFFEERAEELGLEVQTVNGENSPTTQDRVARDLLRADMDGMIIQPPDPVAAVGTIQAIQAEDVPLLIWGNGEVPGIEAPYVSLDEREQTFEAGKNAATWVKENMPGEPIQMVVIDIPGVAICEDYRMGQFIEGAKSVDPGLEIVAQPNGAGVRAQSKKVMEDVLRSGKDFNIMTACNGESALGAISALEAAGRGKATGSTPNDKKPESEYIFTIDGSPAEVQKLLDPGSSVMEVLMLTPYENARKLADLVAQNMKGELDPTFRDGIGGILTGPDCEEANTLLEREYGETVEC